MFIKDSWLHQMARLFTKGYVRVDMVIMLDIIYANFRLENQSCGL